MKLETFFEKFDKLADTPDGVKSMRELILRLAFSGGHTGKRPTQDGVPEGWVICTFESISASISSGFACSRNHQVANGHVHLRTHNISTLGTLNFDLLVRIDPKMVDPQRGSIRAGDILFNNTNSQELVGKTCLVDRDYEYGFSNHITRIRLKEGIYPGFVVFYLTLLRNSGYFSRLCTRWINQAAVNNNTLKEQTIPLPPLAEQKRIVAKVDELMALCDRLEAQQQEQETRHADLARASLARFADAPTPANLDFMFHPSYAIAPADLRKCILTLAVQGKLVPQDPNDEAATQQLKTIQAWKAELVRKQVIKKSDPSRPVDLGDGDHEIPDTWAWVRLGEICEVITDGTHLTPKYTESGRIFLSAQNVKPFKFMPAKHRLVSEEHYQGYVKNRKPERGDILLTRVGAGIGEAATIDQDLDFAIYVSLGLVRPVRGFVFSDYITLWLNSPDGTGKSSRNTYGKGVSQGNLNLSLIRNFLVPLPPLAAQRRIVAKVGQLMALVDELESQLTDSRATAANLLAALVAELTAIK